LPVTKPTLPLAAARQNQTYRSCSLSSMLSANYEMRV
jgi:hypothetical protein